MAQAAGHHVIAVDFLHPIRHRDVVSVQADLTLPGAALQIFAVHRPRWAVHCAAAVEVDACEADPETAYRLNRDMAGHVAMAARAVGARLVHISTDAVFDGERGGYAEEDEPRPVSVYGSSKLDGERVVLSECPVALVVRTNIFGWNARPKLSLSEWFLERLRWGERCTGFTDVSFSPIAVTDLSRLLLELLPIPVSGVLHVAGGETVSKYEFGLRIAEAFQLSPAAIVPGSVDAMQPRARRARRLGLDVRKAEALLGAPMPALGPMLRRWRREEADGTLNRLRSLVARPVDTILAQEGAR
ncbi:MAG: SDR family oxidoreductase [Chloroflexi bacterium]|nr:SDR family oxidoreductase [Chloroflexota bacterium]